MPEDRYLELLASRLAEVVTGDSKRLIVNLPPRHFKILDRLGLPVGVDPGARSLGENPDV